MKKHMERKACLICVNCKESFDTLTDLQEHETKRENDPEICQDENMIQKARLLAKENNRWMVWDMECTSGVNRKELKHRQECTMITWKVSDELAAVRTRQPKDKETNVYYTTPCGSDTAVFKQFFDYLERVETYLKYKGRWESKAEYVGRCYVLRKWYFMHVLGEDEGTWRKWERTNNAKDKKHFMYNDVRPLMMMLGVQLKEGENTLSMVSGTDQQQYFEYEQQWDEANKHVEELEEVLLHKKQTKAMHIEFARTHEKNQIIHELQQFLSSPTTQEQRQKKQEQFMEYQRRCSWVNVIAHNGAKYDTVSLLNILIRQTTQVKILKTI